MVAEEYIVVPAVQFFYGFAINRVSLFSMIQSFASQLLSTRISNLSARLLVNRRSFFRAMNTKQQRQILDRASASFQQTPQAPVPDVIDRSFVEL